MPAIAFPRSPFWDFSLRLYARPGVADACLRLQGRRGIDVNLLFYCLWLGMDGERLSRGDIIAAMARVRTLQEQVVKPLRTARTALKRMLDGDPTLSPPIGGLRAAVKKSELDAEHLEQIALASVRPKHTRPAAAPSERPALARANAESYLAALGIRLTAADRVDLLAVIAPLAPKEKEIHAVAPAARKAEKRNRKRPLATARGEA